MKDSRVKKVLSKMEENKIPQLIVTSAESIFYLTGKMIRSGERLIALYLDSNGNHKFIVNKLFPINEDLGVEIVWYDDIENPIDKLSNIVRKGEVLGVDKDLPSHFLIDIMGRNVVKTFVNSSPIIDTLRMIKDEEEIQIMKESSRINDAVMLKLWKNLKAGYSEKYYANMLSEIYEEEGASGFSFSPIIATSPNGADPHHGTGKDKIKVGDSVVLDIGGTHRTGHSIGIECHDFGNVSSVNDDEVKAGMIFSVEPGIYLKDNIGVRIEDLVLVTKDGYEVLNSVTKEITVL